MSRPIWFVDLIKKLFHRRFDLARITHLPVVGNAIDWLLFEGDDVIYLPIDTSLNREIIHINDPLPGMEESHLPSRVVEYFIEKSTHHWIMDFCICRDGENCQDYPHNLGCLFLGEAVKEINPAFGRLVSKEEAMSHVSHCREIGLVHMIGRNKLDTVWLGAGPSHKLLTVCNCCPCCCLWRFLPQVSSQISQKVVRMPGVRLQISDLCAGCGTCVDSGCFVEAISLVGGKAQISEACRGCGRCVDVCPNEAIELIIDDTHFIDDTIRRISTLVDLT